MLVLGSGFIVLSLVAFLLVCHQVVQAEKGLAAGSAVMRFLPGMDSLVLPQVPGLGKALSASVAVEGFLACVDPFVAFDLIGPVKGLAAETTWKQSLAAAAFK